MSAPFALVIDDSRETADSLARMLSLLGLPVQVAYGPRTAINTITRQFPGLIMLDINMPGVDGVEICRFLRRDPRTAHVPIIAMSSDNQPETVARVMAAGADAFLPKPISLEALEKALAALPKDRTE
ncbi:MAG: response regulator [Anaerolineales bacterium]|nr:response regulator [Anaerolineales bacterium]